MFCNGMDCVSGILVFQDVVYNQEQHSQNAYRGELFPLAGNPTITTAHTALHQLDGAQFPEEGWVGDDAWFGSMISVVETSEWKKVHSTFIIKDNQPFVPTMQPLHAVL
jgi:hypothetical protein